MSANLFFLVYGIESLVLVEVRDPNNCFLEADHDINNKVINKKLNIIDIHHEITHIQIATNK